ncbi:MAG: RluA family pseudouridine synthase [Planctomycetota bacterium]
MVEGSRGGVRLVAFLARIAPAVHRVDLRQHVAAGAVRVNGEVASADLDLRPGDVVELLAPLPAPRPVQPGTRELPAVLFESPHALVIDKPAGVPTVPDRAGEAGIHGLLPGLRPGDDLRIVHRLDRDTSGCLILAKGLAAARHFDRAFADGGVAKTYVALAHGAIANAEFTIDRWLGPDKQRPGKVVAAESERRGFRAAHTAVRIRQRFGRHTLLELRPTTGRGHQLRVHLQAIGHPIVGDADYGGEPLWLSRLKPGYKQTGTAERPLAARMFLHAECIAFQDVDGVPVQVDSPLPTDLAPALRALLTHDPPRSPPCA